MIAAENTLMFNEAAQAADVIAAQFARNETVVAKLAAELRANPPPFVVTCARGSSDHACTYAKHVFETQLGLVTASISPSVNSVYAAKLHMPGALYLSISQSGKSPDLLQNAKAARDAGAHVVALVNVEDSPLAELAHTVIPLCAGPERSVAATKSYLASLAAIAQLTAHWAGNTSLHNALEKLPQALRAAWQADWSALSDGLMDARSLFVLGRGPGLAAAQEAALKFKETCGLHAEAYSSAEVKHGPMALVGQGFPVLCFSQADETQTGLLALAQEFRTRGAQVWVASEHADLKHGHLPQPPAPHCALAPLLTIQSFYRAINALSLQRGHNPDLPPHLNKVTQTL